MSSSFYDTDDLQHSLSLEFAIVIGLGVYTRKKNLFGLVKYLVKC